MLSWQPARMQKYKPWVPEEFIFFTLLAGAPSLGKFLYSINVLRTKRCSFSVTLVWSPYAYSPCLHKQTRRVSISPLLRFDFTLSAVEPRSSYVSLDFVEKTREADDNFKISKYIIKINILHFQSFWDKKSPKMNVWSIF